MIAAAALIFIQNTALRSCGSSGAISEMGPCRWVGETQQSGRNGFNNHGFAASRSVHLSGAPTR